MLDRTNPYIAGNPVTGQEMFFGREDVFEFIRRTLVGKHRDNVIILYGQRRTGKTSVLYQMRSRLGTHYLCVFTDLHGFALQGIEGFLWELANHIIRVLHRDYQIDLARPDRAEFTDEPRSFFENEFLGQIWSTVGNRHILLMLDETIRLQEQVQAGKLEHEVFEYLRHLMQHYERLNFLFSLSTGLEEMEKEYAFLFSSGLYKKLSFFDRDATRDLITQPVKDCYEVEPTAVEHISHLTSGHPYHTQLLCHCLFNRWKYQRMSHIQIEDVNTVLNEAMERGSAVLKHVWEESTLMEKAIMAAIATIINSNTASVDTNTVTRAWERLNVSLPKKEMTKAIKSLIARDIITGQESYYFIVAFQRLWVQKHIRLEWIKEEVAEAFCETTKQSQQASKGSLPGSSPDYQSEQEQHLVARLFSVKKMLILILTAMLVCVCVAGTLSVPNQQFQSQNTTKAPIPAYNAQMTAIQATHTEEAGEASTAIIQIRKPELATFSSFVSIAGSYAGTVSNTVGVSAHMELLLQQNRSTIRGTLTVFPPLAPGNGLIYGTTGIDSNGYVYVQFTWLYKRQYTIDFRGYLYTDGSLGGTYFIEQNQENGTWTVR